jgi:hypothetical protein
MVLVALVGLVGLRVQVVQVVQVVLLLHLFRPFLQDPLGQQVLLYLNFQPVLLALPIPPFL